MTNLGRTALIKTLFIDLFLVGNILGPKCTTAFFPSHRLSHCTIALSDNGCTSRTRNNHYTFVNDLSEFRQRSTRWQRKKTAVNMGIRGLIGRIRRKRGNSDDNGEGHYEDNDALVNEMSEKEEENAFGSPLTQSSKADDKGLRSLVQTSLGSRPPLRMGEDPSSKEINVFPLDDKNESTQDRIRRVKSGLMTNEEKAAYLRTALSTGASRPPLMPPGSKPDPGQQNIHTKASPFPGDPIYRSIAGGKEPEPAKLSSDLVGRVGLDMQKRKRDYLDMVTDPHRFDRYRSLSPRESLAGLAQTDDQERIIPVSKPPNQQRIIASQKLSNLGPIPSEIGPIPSNLGDRLAAAANAQEIQRRTELERKKAAERIEAERADEANRRMQEEQIRLQAEKENLRKEKKLKERSRSTKQKVAMQRKLEERQKELVKAQEDYWTRKLAAEREAREKQPDVGRKFPFDPQPPTLRSQSLAPPIVPQAQPPAPTKNTPSNDTSPYLFNPKENEIVELSRQLVDGGEGSPHLPSSFSPTGLNDVKTLNKEKQKPVGPAAFRKNKRNQEDDEQIRRLRELNSPLPSKPSASRPGMSRAEPPPSIAPSFDPQRPISTASGGDRSSVFNNLLRNNLDDAINPAPKTKDLLNVFSGQVEAASVPSVTPEEVVPERRVPSNGQSGSALTSPFETIIENSSSDQVSKDAVAAMFGAKPTKDTNDSRVVASNQEERKPPAPRERKGPIRMKLPLKGDDEDGIDSGENPGMSIAEAMKRPGDQSSNDQEERSKKWGVDMSKFM